MANTITIYKTRLNRENRMINTSNLSSYLATCTSVEIDTSYPIIPNVPFYCDISALAIAGTIYEYNYLSYVYNGVTYYSFIDSIDFMASEYKCRINHTTDYWIMSGIANSLTALPNRLNGRVTRALLEDYGDYNGSTYTPNLYWTFNTTEVEFNNAGLIYTKYKPYLANFVDNYNQLWLYIYVANSNTMSDVWIGSQSSMLKVPNLGITMAYPIVQDKYYIEAGSEQSFWYICYLDTDGNINYMNFSSAYISNSDITSMLISPLPPMDFATYGYLTKTITINSYEYTIYFLQQSRYSILETLSTVEGMIPYLNIPYHFSGINITTSNLIDGFTGSSLTANESSYMRWNTSQVLSSYLGDNPKALSPVYNPVYVEDISLSLMQLPNSSSDTMYTIYLSADLTCYGYTINAETYEGDYCKMHKKQITSAFSPTVLRDYWTRLNASIESISAQRSQTKGIFQAGSSILSTISSAGNTAIQAVSGNVVGAANSAINTTQSAYGTAGTIIDTYYNTAITDRQREIADYQYNTGSTDETAAMYLSGIFDFSDLPTVYTIRQPVVNLQQISYILSTKGENCNLDFWSYWNNHTFRQYYEYIEMTDVVCYECNREIQQNLQQMFAKGVRLWYYNSDTSSIGNPYAVKNYPEYDEE